MINVITIEELKDKLDRGDDFKLVNALGGFAFQAKRIPGSIHFESLDAARQVLDLEDDIVVYCSGPECVASVAAYHMLERAGYKHVRRFSGGLTAWEEAGYPLEGFMVETATA